MDTNLYNTINRYSTYISEVFYLYFLLLLPLREGSLYQIG